MNIYRNIPERAKFFTIMEGKRTSSFSKYVEDDPRVVDDSKKDHIAITDLEEGPKTTPEDAFPLDMLEDAIHPLLIAMGSVGLYFVDYKQFSSSCKTKRALGILHAMFCVGCAIWQWIGVARSFRLNFISHGDTVDGDSDVANFGVFQKAIQLTTSFYIPGIMTAFLWTSYTSQYKKFFTAFRERADDGNAAPDKVNWRRMKYASVVLAGMTLAAGVARQIFVINDYMMTLDIYLCDSCRNDTTIVTKMFLTSHGFVVYSLVALHSSFVSNLPAVVHCWICFLLYKHFKEFNHTVEYHMKRLASSKGKLSAEDLTRWHIQHTQLCKILEVADDIFAPFLLLQIFGGIATICVMLYVFMDSYENGSILWIEISMTAVNLLSLTSFSAAVNLQVWYGRVKLKCLRAFKESTYSGVDLLLTF